MRDSARARVFMYMRLVVAGQNETQHRGGTRLCGKSHSAVARIGVVTTRQCQCQLDFSLVFVIFFVIAYV